MPMRSVIVAALVVLCAPAFAAALKPGASFKDCRDCPEMVVIPPGALDMGFDGGEPERYEGPVRHVEIRKSFAAGKYELTQAQYAAFAKATHRPATDHCNIDAKPVAAATWRDPQYGRPVKDNEPVVCITWTDAKAYVDWLARKTGKPYRLLSEAEWEYVARAGTQATYAWGDDPHGGCTVANMHDAAAAKASPRPTVDAAPCDDGFAGVAPVGSLKPNAFGLYDVIGNVWEWVEDCYAMPYAAAPVDGRPYEVAGACDRRAVRGGAWSSGLFRQRPSWRGRDPESRISQIFGVRIARDLTP